MNVGYQASLAVKTLLDEASPAMTTITNFYAEVTDPNEGQPNQPIQIKHPCVRVWFSEGVENPIGTGNYSGQLNIMIEASADDHTAIETEAMFDEVWAFFYTTDILARLSAAIEDFTAHGVTGGVSQTQQDIFERWRRKTMVMPINCCAADIS